MGVRIIVDSASDLPRELIAEYDMEWLPLVVSEPGKEYLDGETIQSAQLFQEMREGKVFHTAQVPLSRMEQAFRKAAQNRESAIYIAFSSELSGTYQAAVLAKSGVLDDEPSLDLDIVDTKCASLGCGLIALKAAQMAKEGKLKSEILNTVKFLAEHMEHIFTVDNLEYLQRGGRVSKAAAVIGGLLNIKPVLDVEDGKLVPIDKVRGRKKVLQRMIELMAERGKDLAGQTIGISHGDDLEGAHMLRDRMEQEFGCDKFIIHSIGGVIGAHAGPGTLSVFFLNGLKN